MDEASQAHPPTINGKYVNTGPWSFYGGDVYDEGERVC